MERKVLHGKMIKEGRRGEIRGYPRKKKRLVFWFFFICFCLCFLQENSSIAASKIKIMTTIFPLMEFSKAVCGDRCEVSLLLPPGSEVHTWKPRPSDIVRISSADLFIYIGAELEPWIHDLLKSIKNPKLKILEASSTLSLIKEGRFLHYGSHGRRLFDPHIWLDFEIDQLIVDKITSLLAKIDPENSVMYHKNSSLYKVKLQRLDQNFSHGLKDCVQRTFILGGHSAFGYLARRYNLRQVSLYGLSPNSEPTPRQLVEIVDLARKYKIKVVYFEIYISNELAKVIAKEVGAKTLVLNPGANLTKKQLESGVTFFDIMEKNLENLRDGLICK